MTAPMEYRIPPERSHRKAAVERARISGTSANRQIQPMIRESAVLSQRGAFIQNIFIVTPAAAKIQTAISIA